jgi:hypothetical protein
MNFKSLRKQCAECGLLTREKCLSCKTYKILNTPCFFCGSIGGVVPYARTTSKGVVSGFVCPKCMEKLT